MDETRAMLQQATDHPDQMLDAIRRWVKSVQNEI